MYNSIGPDKISDNNPSDSGPVPKKETMSLWDIGRRLDEGLGV